jgi:hypothetical protein
LDIFRALHATLAAATHSLAAARPRSEKMAEILERPIRFLSYLELCAIHGTKVLIHHEITQPSYPLKYNLCPEKERNSVVFEDEFAADIEIAMGVR